MRKTTLWALLLNLGFCVFAAADIKPIGVGISNPVIVGQGGTGATSLTDGGILFGNGVAAIGATDVLTNGQLLIGDGTEEPAVATLTGNAAVAVTNGAGSITLSLVSSSATLLGNSVNLANAEVTGTLPVANGGTGATSLTDGGVLFGGGTGAVTASAVLTNGQLLIGDGTTAPTVAALTAGAGVTITNGAGSITVAANSLENSTPTANGAIGYSQTNKRLGIGDGTNSQQIIMGIWDSWTPAFAGFSANPTVSFSRYARIGNTIVAAFLFSGNGTSNATTYTMTLPVAARSATSGIMMGAATNNGSATTTPCRMDSRDASTTADLYLDSGATAWTATGGKGCVGMIVYEAN